jgi:bacillithiol biosynthesis deacetylase BshB1
VAVVDLTAGERASRGTPVLRAREALRAAAILGLCERRCLGLPDGHLDRDPEAARRAIVGVLRELRPAVVLAPFSYDRHPDHIVAARMIDDACFWAGVPDAGGAAPHRPGRVYQYMLHHAFEPSLVVDVGAGWSRKMEALLAFESQFGGGDRATTALSGGPFLRHLEGRAIWFGGMIGCEYGEPFFCRGPIAADALPLSSAPAASLPPYAIGNG